MGKREMRIQHNFTQRYSNWQTPAWVDRFEARVSTFDILEALDLLEAEVYRDRDYSIANDMLEAIRK